MRKWLRGEGKGGEEAAWATTDLRTGQERSKYFWPAVVYRQLNPWGCGLLLTYVHGGIIHSDPKVEPTQMSGDR